MWKSKSLVYILWQSKCVLVTLCDPMGCNLPGSSIHGIFQVRILEGAVISFSRDRTRVSCIAGRLFTIWATREAQRPPQIVRESPGS